MRRISPAVILFTFMLCLAISPVSAQRTTNKNRKNLRNALPESAVPLPKFEKEILEAINFLRTDPKGYANSLRIMKSSMEGRIVVLPDGLRWSLKEGAAPIDEAIRELNRVDKLNRLEYSAGLSKVAQAQLSNLQQDVSLGHLGADGSDVTGRLFKVGTPGIFTAENIALYSKISDASILQMVLDDGLKSRIHRVNLLSGQFALVGIAYGVDKNDVGICVLVFADKFTER